MENSLIENITELALSPHKSGAYLSKPEISILALVCGFSIILQERKRMIEDLFKAIKSKEELINVVSALIAFYDSKKNDYELIFDNFPATKLALDENYGKCIVSIGKLKEFKIEAELLDFGVAVGV